MGFLFFGWVKDTICQVRAAFGQFLIRPLILVNVDYFFTIRINKNLVFRFQEPTPSVVLSSEQLGGTIWELLQNQIFGINRSTSSGGLEILH